MGIEGVEELHGHSEETAGHPGLDPIGVPDEVIEEQGAEPSPPVEAPDTSPPEEAPAEEPESEPVAAPEEPVVDEESSPPNPGGGFADPEE